MLEQFAEEYGTPQYVTVKRIDDVDFVAVSKPGAMWDTLFTPSEALSLAFQLSLVLKIENDAHEQ